MLPSRSPCIPHVFESCIMLPMEFAVTFYEDCIVDARNARSPMYLLAKQEIQPIKESMGTSSPSFIGGCIIWCLT
eukprot:gene396-11769_t